MIQASEIVFGEKGNDEYIPTKRARVPSQPMRCTPSHYHCDDRTWVGGGRCADLVLCPVAPHVSMRHFGRTIVCPGGWDRVGCICIMRHYKTRCAPMLLYDMQRSSRCWLGAVHQPLHRVASRARFHSTGAWRVSARWESNSLCTHERHGPTSRWREGESRARQTSITPRSAPISLRGVCSGPSPWRVWPARPPH